jgi:twinkle protein
MTDTMHLLEQRGLDVEGLVRKGWTTEQTKDFGERVCIPFVRMGQIVGKKFRRFDGGEPKWSAKWDATPIAYNEDCVRDPALFGKPLICAEGEIDSETALLCGFPKTISVPNGAGGASEGRSDADLDQSSAYTWLRQLREEGLLSFERCPEIILATDGDDAGAKLMHELSVQFGRARCKYLIYPKTRRTDLGRERTKDLNEVLCEYGRKGVTQTIERAQWVQVKGVSLMSALPPVVESKIYDIGFDLLGANWKVRMGDLTVISGIPGFGKTSFVNDVCCRLASNYGIRIAMASFEQEPQRDHKRNLRGWFTQKLPRNQTSSDRAAADKWIDDNFVFIVPDEDADSDLEWMLDQMEIAVVRYNAKIIVIDPFNELDHSRRSQENETDYVGRFLRTMIRFAKRFQVNVFIVAHPAKMQKLNGKYQIPSLYDISGSAHFYNKCTIGIIVHREDEDSSTIKVQKSKYHDLIGVPGEVRMAFCNDDKRFRELERLA